MVSVRNFFGFRSDDDNKGYTGARRVKFVTELDQKRIYIQRVEYCLGHNNYSTATMRILVVIILRDKIEVYNK